MKMNKKNLMRCMALLLLVISMLSIFTGCSNTFRGSYSGSSRRYRGSSEREPSSTHQNSSPTVVQYVEPTTCPTTAETTSDPRKGHAVAGIVTDPSTGNTYYCWDDGTASMSDAYVPTGLTWTHPWGQRFFNIYNGSSDNGNVVYSEKACSWCGSHKTYYYSLIRSSYDYSESGVYLCESCHIDLTSYEVKCSKCTYYYPKDMACCSNGKWYCEKCYYGQ